MKLVALIVIILVVVSLFRHCHSEPEYLEQRYGSGPWSDGIPAPADTRGFNFDYRAK